MVLQIHQETFASSTANSDNKALNTCIQNTESAQNCRLKNRRFSRQNRNAGV